MANNEESIIVTSKEDEENDISEKQDKRKQYGIDSCHSGSLRKRTLSLSTKHDEQPPEASIAKRYAEQDAEQVQVRESKSQVEKRIVGLMQRKRADIDKSNCTEFVAPPEHHDDPYSARTHPAELNRTIQMKLDIADNGGEALARLVANPASLSSTATTNPASTTTSIASSKAGAATSPWLVPRSGSGVEERFRNIEQHLNVKYTTSVSLDVYERLKVLEDKIIQLERDHPTWAAIHFNQPHRTLHDK
ncbi:hypothetical protein BDF22DRAFT_658239 [Syncephalis plumigaleata]|nr:hypothetical protein BDF22DRAFT_658239 [Syncephalis plumigaleata]